MKVKITTQLEKAGGRMQWYAYCTRAGFWEVFRSRYNYGGAYDDDREEAIRLAIENFKQDIKDKSESGPKKVEYKHI